MGTLHFTGPRGKTWNMCPIDLEDPGLSFKIEKSIKQNSGIMSSDWNWWIDLDSGKGQIYVPMRTVGTITFESNGGGN